MKLLMWQFFSRASVDAWHHYGALKMLHYHYRCC